MDELIALEHPFGYGSWLRNVMILDRRSEYAYLPSAFESTAVAFPTEEVHAMFAILSRLFCTNINRTNVHQRKKRIPLELEELERRLTPALNPYVVTTTADDPNVPIPDAVTLRDAINSANASNNQTITFAPGVIGTIQLQAELPDLLKNITITGPTMGGGISVYGSGAGAPNLYRVFYIGGGTTCAIQNLTIASGNTAGDVSGGGRAYALKLPGFLVKLVRGTLDPNQHAIFWFPCCPFAQRA